MSKLPSIAQELHKLEPSFSKQNAFNLKFENECLFAKQQLQKNSYTLQAAQNNPDALKGAILNVAAIGISLNPATAHAYLVPRGGAVCLDISYRGLVKLATDSGSIQWAKAVLVYKGDTFKWRGPAEAPVHEADVFNADRMDAQDPLKNLDGGYCLAKLATGEYMVDVMTAGEILAVRDASQAKSGPWKGAWAGEMAKKTLVKRASKSWPQSDGRHRLDEAIGMLNEHEGIQTQEASEEVIEQFLDLVAKEDMDKESKGMALHKFMRGLTEEQRNTCYNTAPKNEKGKLKDKVKAIQDRAQEYIDDYVTQILEFLSNSDPGALELHAELDDIERELVDARLTDIEHRQLKQLEQEAA
jgi:recombination protein RecT